ncbi:MAG TPA: L,D-transpeptidase [Xanthobacteraceae bacterium]|nr:L,D-transpeptidase [Xanthobacteraceae bacterium]
MRRLSLFFLLLLAAWCDAEGLSARTRTPSRLDAATVNAAEPGHASGAALIVRAEVLLDRAHFSPGAIDGVDGENFHKALAAFQQDRKLPTTGNLDPDTWAALAATSSAPALTRYTITAADEGGPFVRAIPRDFRKMAKLPALGYSGPREELAEKFHMSEALLRKLNPHAAFERSGTEIEVADVAPMDLVRSGATQGAAPPPHGGADSRSDARQAATIEVDKQARAVRAYDRDGRLLAFYPASIGSTEKPAPSGTFKVRRVARNPDYHYDPKFAFKGVHTRHKLTIRPGPNNPVGLVWIDLTAPSYGIHGTPDPDKVSKTASHGCIRLTNWDALDLAAMVHPGVVVKFLD